MDEVLYKKSCWHYSNTTAFQWKWRWQWEKWLCKCVRGGRIQVQLFLHVCLKLLTSGERGEDCYYLPLLHPSINPSSHTHTGTHTDFPNFSEAWNNPPFSPFIPGKSLWILIALLGGVGGQREPPNLVKAEQKWNFDLTEGKIIPGWQSGGYLSLSLPPFMAFTHSLAVCSFSQAAFPSQYQHANDSKSEWLEKKQHIWSNCLHTDMFMLSWSGKSITKLCDKRKSKCTCWIINERLDMTCPMNGLISL